jgi:hypothetical protein
MGSILMDRRRFCVICAVLILCAPAFGLAQTRAQPAKKKTDDARPFPGFVPDLQTAIAIVKVIFCPLTHVPSTEGEMFFGKRKGKEWIVYVGPDGPDAQGEVFIFHIAVEDGRISLENPFARKVKHPAGSSKTVKPPKK